MKAIACVHSLAMVSIRPDRKSGILLRHVGLIKFIELYFLHF